MTLPKLNKFPKWPKFGRTKAMSILIGIICPDGIVLAADSQLTDNLGAYVFTQKISIINLEPDQLLIAQAGLPSMSNRVIEIMREKLEGVQITKPYKIAEIAENAVREARSGLDADQKTHGENSGAELMLAFYAGMEPHLYVIDVYGSGIAQPPDAHFSTAGIGKWVANYLLSEFADTNASTAMAMATCAYVIKKIKDFQKGLCGGDTNLFWLSRDQINFPPFSYITRAKELDKNYLQLVEASMFQMDEINKQSRHKQVSGILREAGNKIMEQWWQKRLKASQEGSQPPENKS